MLKKSHTEAQRHRVKQKETKETKSVGLHFACFASFRSFFIAFSVPLCLCVSFPLAVLSVAGCNRGGDVVRVSGQLVKDGKPYGANLGGKEPETFVVDFVGTIKERPYRFAATIKPDGSFKVGGSDGSGIPRGQYKIAVIHSGFLGAGGDRFNARFAEEKTPLEVDVAKATSLTIDLGAGTVAQH
jgi:hypothetical protein